MSYNDAKLLGPFALNPSFLVAFELDGQADAGSQKGVYAQIGIAPGYTFFAESAYPLAVSVPLAVGLSLSDYYEFGTGSDETFGYFSGGVSVSVPLAFIPPVRQVADQGRRPGALPRRQPEGHQQRGPGPGDRHPRPGLRVLSRGSETSGYSHDDCRDARPGLGCRRLTEAAHAGRSGRYALDMATVAARSTVARPLRFSNRSLHVPAACIHARAEGGMTMQDVLYIGLTLGFLALSWGLVVLCDRL